VVERWRSRVTKKRVYQVAKEFRISSEALVGMLTKLGCDVKTHMNTIDDEDIERVRAEFEKEKEAVKREYAKKVQRAVRERKAASAAGTVPTTSAASVAQAPPAQKPFQQEQQPLPRQAPRPVVPRDVKPVLPVGGIPIVKPVPRAPVATPAAKIAPSAAPPATPRTTEAPPAAEPPEVRPIAPTVVLPAARLAKDVATAAREAAIEALKRKRRRKPRIDQKSVEDTVRRTLAGTLDRRTRRRRRREHEDAEPADAGIEPGIQIAEFSSVAEFAERIEVPANDVIKKCLDLGLLVTINQRLDEDTILLLANEFGEEVEFIHEYGEDILDEDLEKASEGVELVPRAPVVAVMGHVDHGKTLLLDHIRSANVVSGEAGGITQHIGAYEVDHAGKRITFLDTPGHEAFTAMRARGAQITDIVVLVVAATEGVMPQTIEAIDHARAAGVPVIVAINKMDLPAANTDKVKTELANAGLTVEEWGGDIVAVETSAKTGAGVDKLLDMIVLQSELLELRSTPVGPARAVVIEVEKERGRGVVATALVEAGTLRVGDPFVVGLADGKVRALYDDRSRSVQEAGPSMPVLVSGLTGVPQAGDALAVVSDEKLAREISAKRRQQQWERQTRFEHRVTLEDLHKQIVDGAVKDLGIIIKGDVDGSVGALADALEKLSTIEVKVVVIRKAVGAVTETDVLLAAASNAVIIGFHIGAAPRVKELAKREHVEIRLYKVIYEVVEDIRAAMEGMLEPERREVPVGRAEVREVFHIPHRGVVAGSYVLSGSIKRGSKARVIREEMVVFEGTIGSLKRFKDDVREVQTGFECGIGLEGLADVHANDLIETYDIEEVARKLSAPTAR
jgi:translation initiation factor IF-2